MKADPYLGMDPLDRLRAVAYVANQRAIQVRREAAARALLAPSGPAREVKVQWAPVSPRVALGIDWQTAPVDVVTIAHGAPDETMADRPATPYYMDLETGTLYQAQEAPSV